MAGVVGDDKVFYGIKADNTIFKKYRKLLKLSDACNWSYEQQGNVPLSTRYLIHPHLHTHTHTHTHTITYIYSTCTYINDCAHRHGIIIYVCACTVYVCDCVCVCVSHTDVL